MAAMVDGATLAAQVAQQKLQDPTSQQPKPETSKFDGMMADKAQQAQATQKVQPSEVSLPVQKIQGATLSQLMAQTQVAAQSSTTAASQTTGTAASQSVIAKQEAGKALNASSKEPSKVMGSLSKMMGDLEKGQGVMDKLIHSAMSGRTFSNSELLGLQAGMYKYTQELELTGKVVQKATDGMKETLKTQV